MAEVRIHPQAEAEYEAAFAWYYERSPSAALRFEIAFDAAVEAIRSHPTSFPLVDEIHRIVRVERYPYLLVYRSDGLDVQLIAVTHAKRSAQDWSDLA